MTQEFDPKKSYLCLKTHEKMIAFAGFDIQSEDQGQLKEGVIKISSFQRPYGGGYLTLTFIVNTENDPELKAHLNRLFSKLTEDSLRPYLGKKLDKIVKVSLDSLEKIEQWYIEEVSVHFRSYEQRLDVLIEEGLFPALKSTLSFSFDPVEWWPQDKPAVPPDAVSFSEQMSLRALFRKWFKAR